MKFYLYIHDWMMAHKKQSFILLFFILLILSFLASRLSFSEDISDFLPMSKKQKNQMRLYSQISGSNKILILFSMEDTTQIFPDRLCDAINTFDSIANYDILTQVDINDYYQQIEKKYNQIPYFLNENDYERIDTLLTKDKIHDNLITLYNKFMLPMTSILRYSATNDPLNLFDNTQDANSQFSIENFSLYDGYIMTSDNRLAFAFLTSPYGDSETKKNTLLVENLESIISIVKNQYKDVNIRLIGGPPVAVSNAKQIKTDISYSIAIASILILTLLYLTLQSWKKMLLIALTVAFGFIFGMGIMGLVHPNISLIVFGIASVIIGIVVNYPLHFIVHHINSNSTRNTLQEELTPLIIGNITTVGAFLTLIPLDSIALRDLGIFCAAMLIGTIIFTLFFLPLFNISSNTTKSNFVNNKITQIASFPLGNKKLFVAFCILTIILGWFGQNVSFDSNLSNINYLTKQQKEDFSLLAQIAGQKNESDVEIFIPCTEDLSNKIARWNNFWTERNDSVIKTLRLEAQNIGFAETAFAPFEELITKKTFDDIPADFELAKQIYVPAENADSVLNATKEAFSIKKIQESMTSSLSDNFSYIGTACSIIVFIFLWICFKNFWIALVAFIPIAISWIWILGLMNIFGLQFNIVNIILATFIFGQGDDYAIFMTEGLIYEHKYGKSMLPQYKKEILLSAIIMFIGIGVLIIAQHPAIFSLGAIVLIGMFSVVLISYILPPILFKLFINLKLIKL